MQSAKLDAGQKTMYVVPSGSKDVLNTTSSIGEVYSIYNLKMRFVIGVRVVGVLRFLQLNSMTEILLKMPRPTLTDHFLIEITTFM